MSRASITNLVALSAALALAAPAARAQTNLERDPEPDQLFLTVRATAGQQELTTVSHKLEWSVVSLATGGARVRMRIPVASFHSGDELLDEQVSRALDAARYPFVVVEGTALAAAPVQFQGQITIRGVTRPFTALLTLNRSGMQLAVSAALKLDLEDLGIVPPIVESAPLNLARARVDKKLELDFAALLSIQPRSLVSGGFVDSSASE